MAKVKLFTDSSFRGTEETVTKDVINFKSIGINDQVSSIEVIEGSWQIYWDADYRGKNVTVSQYGGPHGDGKYPNPESLGGINDHFSSIKLVNDQG